MIAGTVAVGCIIPGASAVESEESENKTETEELYTWVIPCEYNKIEDITNKYFTVLRDEENGMQHYDLYDWEGKKRIGDMLGFSFYENWIIAHGDEGYALYTYDDTECRVPQERSYEALWLKDETTAVGVQGIDFLPPGYWTGTSEIIDTATGEVTETLDEARDEASLLPERFIISDELFKSTGADELKFVMDSDTPTEPLTVHDIKVYNADGQLLFDTGENAGKVWSHLEVSCGGNIFRFYGDDGTSTARNWTYTGRGRQLLKKDALGLLNGQYLAVVEKPCGILTRDGETVLDGLEEILCNYAVKSNDGSGLGDTVSESDDLVIVKKDGHWGVIRLKEHMPSPSNWAVEEAGKADETGIVPEEVKLWWRDSCTRLEFCRMLARAVEAATGSKITELSADAEPVKFSDCEDADVLAAASLGIIQGVGHDKFAPGVFLTREQAATLISRTADLFDTKLKEEDSESGEASKGEPIVFGDADEIASWAVDGVEQVSTIVSKDGKAVMQGTGNGMFSPKRYYTVEQSAITLYRLIHSV